MMFEAIRRNTAPSMVVAQILQKLQDGDLKPGARLPAQRELAQMLGVGRSSIREAINALVVMGYLEAVQGRGTFICEKLPTVPPAGTNLDAALQAGTIFHLMEARELLECKSAELAAERAEPSQIQALRQALDDMQNSGGKYDLFFKADMALHNCLAEATGNVVIAEMTKLVLKKVIDHHARLRTTLLSTQYLELSTHSARQIVDHVANGDGAQAAKWMRTHLNAIRQELNTIWS